MINIGIFQDSIVSEKSIQKMYDKYSKMSLKQLKEARIMMFKMLTMEKNSIYPDEGSIKKYEQRTSVISSLIREKEVNNG